MRPHLKFLFQLFLVPSIEGNRIIRLRTGGFFWISGQGIEIQSFGIKGREERTFIFRIKGKYEEMNKN